ncbi:Cof-type HAD-IIB family hydrolase [Chromobacterium phragmitis]|uniref:Cof-type HAD-IIB family hydrolase n=1 Tax=Chromobacterium phragmitis TaxID=2202141 RepID=A0A344UL56_9NEIS|nr:Cof-type HAD-IIB family hydrolase [Chromobacterium phragmitis]AXE32677.1 Cof-type HAD-IIB family hydrolase [Chromobacterium phragmitis]AXE36004.1 Cof-type HAD-IIB family hydrolase [Chromobacterium phragmitis]
MPYRFIASDLDGTLLDPHHAVDPLTAETLRRLEARGVQFALATGRHYLDVKDIRQALGVRAHLITSNGARVHDPDDVLIHRRDIDAELVRAIAQPAFAAGCIANFYLDDEWLISEPNQALLDMHKDSGMRYRVRDLARHGGEGVGKVLYIAPHEHLLGVERKLRARFGDRLYITFSLEHCLEVMAAGVSKGHALEMVLTRLGISADACLAFGDGQNDVELLRAAGHPRVMGNAHPRLSDMLPQAPRIGSHADAGVARHLRQLFAL